MKPTTSHFSLDTLDLDFVDWDANPASPSTASPPSGDATTMRSATGVPESSQQRARATELVGCTANAVWHSGKAVECHTSFVARLTKLLWHPANVVGCHTSFVECHPGGLASSAPSAGVLTMSSGASETGI